MHCPTSRFRSKVTFVRDSGQVLGPRCQVLGIRVPRDLSKEVSMPSHFVSSAGSQTMPDFCEQLNPRALLENRQRFPEMRRVQESWVASFEKQSLLWMAARTPSCVSPDHLTILGLVAQIGAGACYALAAW